MDGLPSGGGGAIPPGAPLIFAYAGGAWDLTERAHIVGVLNLTPDSFYDGGRHDAPARAIARAEAMASEGADGLDVGAQSTRPGADALLGVEEEWARLRPVLPEIVKRVPLPISVDTYHAEVARRALEHGAVAVNDVTALAHDPGMARVVADAGAGLVLMHSHGGPGRFHEPRAYSDLGGELLGFFDAALRGAEARGIPRERVALDPGVGFSKRAEQSVEALRSLPRLTALGRPLYVGLSRKSFLGALTGRGVEERLAASLGAAAAACALGARIFRVHDVRETRDALRAAEAFLGNVLEPAAGPLP